MEDNTYFQIIPEGDFDDSTEGVESTCESTVNGSDCVAPHNHDNLYYRKQEINEIINSLGVDEEGHIVPAVLEENIISTVAEGNINPGDTMPQGMTFTQFVKTFLIKILTPTLQAPSLLLSNNVNSAEVGSNFNLVISATFNPGAIRGAIVNGIWNANAIQNPRAGLPISYRYVGFNSGGDIIHPTDELINSANNANYKVLPGFENFTVILEYGNGAQPLDSKGANFGSPLINGTISSATLVIGLYKTFYGPVSLIPTTGEELRNTPENVFSNITEFTLNTGTNDTNFIIGIPPGKSLNSVIDLDASNQIITGDYVLINSNFQGLDAGGGAVTYKLYVKTNGTPYTTNHRHLINLI